VYRDNDQTVDVDHELLIFRSIASGTSMASPYVAGAYALLFDKSGKLPAQDVRQRFLNAAVPGHFFNHTKPAPVAKQGGGLINVKNAITSKV